MCQGGLTSSAHFLGVRITFNVRFYLFVINHRFPTTLNEWRASVESHTLIFNLFFWLMKYKLPIVLLLLFFSFNASAYDFKVDNIYYNVLSLEKMIVETTGMLNNYSGDVVIPETVEYKGRTFKVVAIGDATFYRCADLNYVTIPSSITIIKDAFVFITIEQPKLIRNIRV